MKVSVVIPAYNEEKYIKNCLTNLVNQTEKPDEVILVDNNCTDDTTKIAAQFEIKIIIEKTQGMIPARNAGFNAAQYEIIARTDSDSNVPSNWIQIIKESFKEPDTVAVSGPVFFYDSSFSTIITTVQTFIFFNVSKLFLGHNVVNGPNFAIKKTEWEKIKDKVCMNDKEVHEDMDIAIHLHKFGNILFIPEMRTKVSARRIKYNLSSILTDYLYRWIRTMMFQKHLTS